VCAARGAGERLTQLLSHLKMNPSTCQRFVMA
jgi:hypothetical protein